VNGGTAIRLAAWAIALGLLALPVVGVLNGWFASERWPIGPLAVSAEFNHVSAAQIRAAALPLLGQGFFAVRLDAVRDAVAQLPWVQRVEARKRWPDTIELVVYEQQPYARWGEDRLVNRQGALFRVAGAAAVQGLPRLSGPDDRLAEVLAFYADCLREFAGSGLVIGALALSPRGGWRLELASGAVIEVGREDPHPRLKRFLDIWPRLAASHPEAPAYADLRYENGFAVRWAESGDSGLGSGDSPTAGRVPDLAGALATAATHRDAVSPPLRIPNPESRIPVLQ
jgi:cell division protein FtsQ